MDSALQQTDNLTISTQKEKTHCVIKRDLPLDFVKGALVISMVIYHLMNFFSTADPEGFKIVRFVTGAFIFLSGYNIPAIYCYRYLSNKNGILLRLLKRGTKLLTMFTVLNLAISITGFGNPTKNIYDFNSFINNIFNIYIVGIPRIASFQILLPISYVLIISPIFLFISRHYIYTASILITLTVILSSDSFGSVNFSLGIVGFFGFAFSMVTRNIKFDVSRIGKAGMLGSLVASIYISKYLCGNAFSYTAGIAVMLQLAYDLARTLDLSRKIYQWIILIGNFSLLCYIMQIIFLQLLLRLLPNQRWGFGYEIVSIFMATNLFLLVLCVSLRYLRKKSLAIDRSYRVIFS